MKKILLFFALALCATTLFAQPIYNEDGIRLYHTPSQEEMDWAKSKGLLEPVRLIVPPPTGQLRPIAEWEPAEAVLVAYPFGIPISLIKEMAKDITVITIVASSSQQSTVLSQYNSNEVNTANCKFLIASSDTYWTRDYGPWFMAIDNSDVAMFDFYYNRPARPNDNQINTYLKTYLSNNGKTIERYASNLWLTGGNYMNDGLNQGYSTTLVTTENLQNLGLTEQQVKQQLHDYLGHEQYHFIADAIYPYDQIQHIDCWGKLLGPDKVLVDSVAPTANNYSKFQAAANYFRAQTSAYGTPYQVYRVFAPGATSSSPKTPYSNSLILNNKVFVPVNTTPTANDNAALQVYQQAMPGYEVIGIPYGSWLNTDALHCRTHEIADRCMVYIKHQPKNGEIANTGSVTFNAEVYSYCQKPIVADSVRVFVKASGDSQFVPYNMLNVPVGSNNWEATITGLPGGITQYYVIAADNTGKRESHPYIARYAPNADPHKFTLIGDPPQPTYPKIEVDKTISSVTSYGNEIVKDFITISNTGDADLTFNITNIDFDNLDMLKIEPITGTVAPGGSQIITLSYDFNTIAKSQENAYFEGSFIIESNDSNTSEIEITLSAELLYILAPVLSLDKDSSFIVSTGLEMIEDYITISNLGNADLTFEIKNIEFEDMLTITPLTGTVEAGVPQMITLSYDFANVNNGDYLGSFILVCNDPLQPETEITLHAYQNYNSINDSKMSLLYIYPNPATQIINIYFNDENPVKAYIYNILGVQLKEILLTKGANAVNIKGLSNGVYFIKIENAVYKFVKL